MSSFYGNGGYSSGGGGGSGDARKNALGTRYSNV